MVMSKDLSLNDISSDIGDKVYSRDYSEKTLIDGVKNIALKTFISEDGDFGEIIRLNSRAKLKRIPGFTVAQINRTTLLPGSVKAWHLHLKQDEIWFVVPRGHVLVGLWDVRKNSPTSGKIMRVVLGGGQSTLLFIPKGVAHGSLNLSDKSVELFYFVDRQFDINDPDEKRIPWDAKGKDFWKPQGD